MNPPSVGGAVPRSEVNDGASQQKRLETFNTQTASTHYPTDSLILESTESQRDGESTTYYPGPGPVEQSSEEESEEMVPAPTPVEVSSQAMAQPQPQGEVLCTTYSYPDSLLPPVEVITENPVVCRNYVLPSNATMKTLTTEVEVPMVEERLTYKPVKQRVARPMEVPKYVPKIIKQEVVEFKEVVTDEIIEVDKPYRVEQRVPVAKYFDAEMYTCVSQNVVPTLRQESPIKEVESIVYEPEFHVHDVYVPQVIGNNLVVADDITRYHRLDQVPPPLWNALLLKLNPHMNNPANHQHLPLHKNADGSVTAYYPEETVAVPLGYVNYPSATTQAPPQCPSHEVRQREILPSGIGSAAGAAREFLPSRPSTSVGAHREFLPSRPSSAGPTREFLHPQPASSASAPGRVIPSFHPHPPPYREIGDYLPGAIPLIEQRRATEAVEGTSNKPLCAYPNYPGFDVEPETKDEGVRRGETLNGMQELLPFQPLPVHQCPRGVDEDDEDEDSSEENGTTLVHESWGGKLRHGCCGCGAR